MVVECGLDKDRWAWLTRYEAPNISTRVLVAHLARHSLDADQIPLSTRARHATPCVKRRDATRRVQSIECPVSFVRTRIL